MVGLADLLAARAGADPDASAFSVDGEGDLSYQSWDRRSNALARGLSEVGVGVGDRVVLRFEVRHWSDYAVASAGVLKVGAVAVPVSADVTGVDTSTRGLLGPGLAAAVDHSGAAAIVVDRRSLSSVAEVSGAAPIATVHDLGEGQDDAALTTTAAPPPPGVVEISYRARHLRPPRAVAHTEAEILRVLDAAGPGPMLHTFAIGSDPARNALWAPLGSSGVMGGDSAGVVVLAGLDPERFCELSVEQSVRRWCLVPATAALVLESGAPGRHDLSSVRRIDLVGPRHAGSIVARLAAAFPDADVVTVATTDEPPPRVDGGQEAPVALSQEGMLWQEQFVPGSQNLPPLVRRFRGFLAAEVLEAALGEIVRRHEPLRTRFELRGGRPVQIVAPPERLVLPVHDLVDLSPGDQQAALAAALADASRPFDLVRGPLFGAALFRFAPDDHFVVFRVHHSVYDDWSVSVFRRELSALYAALLAGDPSPLADLPLGFAEFSRAQRRRMAGDAGAAQLSWWRDRLAGAPFCLQLPIDDPAESEGSPQASARPVSVELPARLGEDLRALARRYRATLFMTTLAAFQVLVHRYTGQPDLLMASVVANRNRPELEAMIGCFTKKILLRQDMGGDPTFAEVLARTRASVLGALPNQDLAFETILQDTVGPRAAEHGLAPYVGVMFQGVTPQQNEVVLPGVTTSGYDTSATTTRAHFVAGPTGDGADAGEADVAPDMPWGAGLYLGTFLILSLVEGADGVSLTARGAFDRPAVERLLANLVAGLGEIVADPSRRVSELALLDHDQSRRLEQWNDTGDDVPIDQCAHEVFRDQAARTPTTVAVRTDAIELTFADLDARAGRLAAHLALAGVGRGSLVGICLEPSEHCLVAVLGIWRAGAGYVALDPDDDDDHLALVVGDAPLDVVVTRPALHRNCLASLAHLVDVEVAVDEAGPAGPGTASKGPAGPGTASKGPAGPGTASKGPAGPGTASKGPARPGTASKGPAGPGDVALVFYGSGPSQVERGVVIEHRSVMNLLIGLRHGAWPSAAGLRVALSAMPTDDAFVRHVVSLVGGHTLHVVGPGTQPAHVVSLVADARIDLIDIGPEHLEVLVTAGLRAALQARSHAAVTPTVVVGLRHAADDRTWRTLRGLRGAHALVVYGPPECGFGATLDPTPGAGARVTIGRPMANVTAHVLGPSGLPLPVQVCGELHVGGAGLARRTDAEPAIGLYRTGQRARYLPDGRIELMGATADAMQLGGFCVDRARLQAALARHPGVRDVRVAIEQAVGGSHLVAYVVPEAGSAPTLAQLRIFLWSQLPGFAWPASVVLVPDGPALADARADETTSRGPADAATGEAEKALLSALWAEVVGVDRVDADQNYWQTFAFLDVVTRAAEAGVRIDGHRVARNRTLATLAADLAVGRQAFG